MATFKHISSKNSDYGAAEKYLLFDHDEFTNKPVLDKNGKLIPRENCCFTTLNCGDDDFAIACMKSNLQYGKNRNLSDVKSHHYIISFDPRDSIENGLTVDRAQELGEQFCKEHFAGHQAIVAHIPTVTTIRGIFTATLSSTACELLTFHSCRIWTDPPTRTQAASTAAPKQR